MGSRSRRTILVGDVHGCARELRRLLDRVGLTDEDALVFVGDLVAKGPDSRGVLAIARKTRAKVVRGNHEDKLLDWRKASLAGHPESVRLGADHRQVAAELSEKEWRELEAMPLWIDLPAHRARVVHAGVVPGRPIEDTRPRLLLSIRTLRKNGAADPRDGKALWGSRYVGLPHVVFGHNAAPGLQLHPWATGLDTGCVYGRELTALVLGEGQRIPQSASARRALLVSVKAARVYATPKSRRGDAA